MCWAYTLVFEKNDRNILLGNYVTQIDWGAGIRENGYSITWTVPIKVITQMALAERRNPMALAADQIRRYIMEYYKHPCSEPTNNYVSIHTETS